MGGQLGQVLAIQSVVGKVFVAVDAFSECSVFICGACWGRVNKLQDEMMCGV